MRPLLRSLTMCRRYLSSTGQGGDTFAAALEKLAQTAGAQRDHPNAKEEEKRHYAHALRNSKFVSLGQPEGKVVVGHVVQVVHDDLYIDFGCKFECVCKLPQKNSEKYRRGAKVLVRLHDLELSSRFIGADKDLTFLEAHATLIGLAKSAEDTRA